MWLSVAIYGAATVVAAVLTALARRSYGEELFPSLFAGPRTVESGAASLAIGLLIAVLVVYGGRRLESREWYRRMAELLAGMVKQLLGPRAHGADFFALAFASSIGEEALFRGFVQPALRLLALRAGAVGPAATLAAVVAGAAVFASFHGLVGVKALRPWTVFAFAIGVAWGALAAWSGSLVPSIASHFLINFLNLKRLHALELRSVAPARADG